MARWLRQRGFDKLAATTNDLPHNSDTTKLSLHRPEHVSLGEMDVGGKTGGAKSKAQGNAPPTLRLQVTALIPSVLAVYQCMGLYSLQNAGLQNKKERRPKAA